MSEVLQQGLIPEDLLRYSWLEDVALDPTGTVVAYTVKRIAAEADGYVADCYLQPIRQRTVNCLTDGRGIASSLAWSSDGHRLAFAWQEEGSSSVIIRNTDSDRAMVYPIDGEPLSGLDWAPNGKWLAGARWTPSPASEPPITRAAVPPPRIKVIRRLRYRQDDIGYVHDRFRQIWVLDLESGDLIQITHDECDFSQPRWSQQGDRLAFVGMAREQNTALGQGQIFVCDFPGGAPHRLLPDWVGAAQSPVWGADDALIAFAGHESAAPTNRRVFSKPYIATVATGKARCLAPDLDQEVGNYAFADTRKALTNVTLKWPAGSPWIYFLLTEEGATHLYRIDTGGNHERLVDGPCVVFEYGPAASGAVAYGRADPSNPGDLFVWQDRAVRQLTALNPWLGDRWLAKPEEYWYDGVEGSRVQAWAMQPRAHNGARLYPTVVYVHCSMFSWDFSHDFQSLASDGFIVAYFNQRGTTAGYGQAWTRASQGDQGGSDYREIMLGVDDLIRRFPVDASRMGVTGGSCGGFLTNWIIGHTDRFRAAVAQRSISNYISFFGTSDIGPECTERETNHSPWENVEAVWTQSPIAYAPRVNTPLLLLHSDCDHRCAQEQAEQMFAALRWLGREVELVIFEGESHELLCSGRPGNRIERLRRILGWFEKYLGTQPIS